MGKKFSEILYNVQSAYDFMLNSAIIQEDKELFKDCEKEMEETENYLCDLHDDRDFYYFQLNQIRNIVKLHEDDEICKTILSYLNEQRL